MHLLLESTFVKSLLQENLFVHMVSHASVGGDDKVTPSDVSDSVLINAAIHSEGSPVHCRAQTGETSFLQSLGAGVGWSRVFLEHCSSRLQPFGDSGSLQGLIWPLKWKMPSTQGVLNAPSAQAAACLCFGHQGSPTQDSL